MLKRICKFLSIIVLAISCVGGTAYAESNLHVADIGEYGTWATDANREKIISDLSHDIDKFAPDTNTQIIDNYVPIEAKVGLAFINAMTHVANIIDNALVRFVIMFMIIMYIFWVMGEAYNNMKTGWDIQKLGKDILIKTLKIIFWIAVLNFGPARLFTMIITPIIMIGTYAAELILNAVTMTVGIELPDTCTAIQNYVAANIAPGATIDADAAAGIMCLPTRLSTYMTSGIGLGWHYIKASIGTSAFVFLLGVAMIWIFIVNAWKFTFMAFGVIADIFIAIIMLPFTALAETISNTSYKGIPGTVYNSFVGLFKAESLNAQFARIISATIYFIVLAVVIAVCVALMGGVIVSDATTGLPSVNNTGFMPLFLTGFLVWYLASRADEIAKDWGGSIKDEFGKKLRTDVETLAKDVIKTGKQVWDAIKSDD